MLKTRVNGYELKNHEAIVSERDFELVQRLLAMDTRTAPGNNEVYNLSGLVICADCGVPMVRKNSTSGGRHYSYYMCATNKYSKIAVHTGFL